MESIPSQIAPQELGASAMHGIGEERICLLGGGYKIGSDMEREGGTHMLLSKT